ncbi:hypothetical protein HanIR_Chr14g0671771 [Helianthus annuus]|nr:hypothetical protein HanIR_Chr14g0671771 [Helianthus annuus]
MPSRIYYLHNVCKFPKKSRKKMPKLFNFLLSSASYVSYVSHYGTQLSCQFGLANET